MRDSPIGVGNKAWRWQKCSLLGYIQSRPAGSGRAARSRRLTLASQQKQCEGMFPGNEKDLAKMVASNAHFQQQFGGAHPVRRRVCFFWVQKVVFGRVCVGMDLCWNDLFSLTSDRLCFWSSILPSLSSQASVGATKILFVDYSDDPWQTASVLVAGKEWPKNDLHFCYEKCDGCGHCGAGVPKNVTKCNDEIAERVRAWVSE